MQEQDWRQQAGEDEAQRQVVGEWRRCEAGEQIETIHRPGGEAEEEEERHEDGHSGREDDDEAERLGEQLHAERDEEDVAHAALLVHRLLRGRRARQ